MNAEAYTEQTGLVPVRSRSGRILAHIWRGDGRKSVCGRYDTSRLNPQMHVANRVRECKVCIEHAGKYT